MEIIFFLSAFSSSEVLGKNASIRSKVPTAACRSREKRAEGVKPTCFMSKATSVPQGNHSQYSSPVEALNLIMESKSPPVEVNNSTIELHLPVEAKEKLAIIDSTCGLLVKLTIQLQTQMTVWALRQILSRFHPWRAFMRPSSPIVFQPLSQRKLLEHNIKLSFA